MKRCLAFTTRVRPFAAIVACAAGLAFAACSTDPAPGERAEAEARAAAPLYDAACYGYAAPAAPLGYEDLKTLIRTARVDTAAQLFAAMAASPAWRPMLDSAVLNARSFALHRELVTPAFPRIILHGERLLFMTTGDPANPVSNLFEIIEFLPSEARYAFRLINLNASEPDKRFIDDANTETGLEGVMACDVCHAMHGAERKPRWMTPPLWQTPFGRIDHRLEAGSRYAADWQAFQETLADPARGALYRPLTFPARTAADGSIELTGQPNLGASRTLSWQTMKRIARSLRAAPRYAEFRYATAGAFLGCDVSSFLPAAMRGGHEAELRAAAPEQRRRVWIAKSNIDLSRAAAHMAANPASVRDDALFLSLAELLEWARVPLVDALTAHVRATNLADDLMNVFKDRVAPGVDAPIDFTGVSKDGVPLSGLPLERASELLRSEDAAYEPIVARLRYLFEGHMPPAEAPQHWSYAQSFPVGASYRFADGGRGLVNLLRCELGPELLESDPTLRSRFSGPYADPAAVVGGTERLCADLAERSRAALAR